MDQSHRPKRSRLLGMVEYKYEAHSLVKTFLRDLTKTNIQLHPIMGDKMEVEEEAYDPDQWDQAIKIDDDSEILTIFD